MKKIFGICMVLFALVNGLQASNNNPVNENTEDTEVASYSLKGQVIDTEMDEALAGTTITMNGKNIAPIFPVLLKFLPSGRVNIRSR